MKSIDSWLARLAAQLLAVWIVKSVKLKLAGPTASGDFHFECLCFEPLLGHAL